MSNSVVSDSTFYIAFLSQEEINEPQILKKILQVYKFHLGRVILDEIYKKNNDILKEIEFEKLVNIIDTFNFSALLSPIGDKVFEKGEYESMAIAWFLLKKKELYSLIIDDKPARKYLSKNIPQLKEYLKYSTRFIADCYLKDGKLSQEEVLHIFNKIKMALNNGARPFNVTEDIINQLIEEVRGCQK